MSITQTWRKTILATIGLTLMACGRSFLQGAVDAGSDGAGSSDAGLNESGAPTLDAQAPNACGGDLALTFNGESASPGDACGLCKDGEVICAAPNVLACVGGRAGDCDDAASPANACGGTGTLSFDGGSATPGDLCGACNEGVIVCASPTLLICVGGSEDCVDAGRPDAGLDAGFDAGLDAGAPCVIPESSYTASAPAQPVLPPETAPVSTTSLSIALATNDLVFNPFDGFLYASLPSSVGADGNSIAAIDPNTGVIDHSIFVGSEPTKLALTDDGRVMWVGLSGTDAFRSVDLVSRFANPLVPLTTGRRVIDLDALPGSETSVLVTTLNGFSGANNVALFVDGVETTSPPADRFPFSTSTVSTYSPHLAYVFGGGSSSDYLTALCIDDAGLHSNGTSNVLSSYLQGITFQNNVIYAENGLAYDIASNKVLGTYTGAPNSLWSSVAPDSVNDRVFVVKAASGSGTVTVTAYDQAKFVPLASEGYAVAQAYQAPHLIRWGRYGLAFDVKRSSDPSPTTLVIARSTLVPTAP